MKASIFTHFNVFPLVDFFVKDLVRLEDEFKKYKEGRRFGAFLNRLMMSIGPSLNLTVVH